jgi:flagella basal body P-ring formation protein FlgA
LGFFGPVLANETGIDTRIVVAQSSHVEGNEILLGDVAEITAEGMVREILADISLGRSPRPGKVKSIRKRQLRSSLRSHEEILAGASMTIPDVIYVKRNSQTLSDQEIEGHVNRFLSRSFPDREYLIETIKLPREEEYPSGKLDIRIVPGQGVDKNGKFSLSMDVNIDGKKQDRIRVSGRVAVYETMACAGQDLLKGHQVLPEHIILESKNIFNYRQSIIKDPALLEGKVLKTSIRKGTPIQNDWLKPLPLIKKGDVVTLVAQKKNLIIVASGVSREDGFKDSMIQVENSGSGKIIRGLVRKQGTVEVLY